MFISLPSDIDDTVGKRHVGKQTHNNARGTGKQEVLTKETKQHKQEKEAAHHWVSQHLKHAEQYLFSYLKRYTV